MEVKGGGTKMNHLQGTCREMEKWNWTVIRSVEARGMSRVELYF